MAFLHVLRGGVLPRLAAQAGVGDGPEGAHDVPEAGEADDHGRPPHANLDRHGEVAGPAEGCGELGDGGNEVADEPLEHEVVVRPEVTTGGVPVIDERKVHLADTVAPPEK